MKKFYIPGYYSYFSLIQILDLYKESHPFYFYPDRIIAGSYDLPWGLKWNGGRGCGNTLYSEKDIQEAMNYYYKKSNFILLHTCTNFYADTMLDDKLCNNFIQTYYRPQDKVIVANTKLKSYLHEKYPQISFVNSTTLSITDINKVNALSKEDDYVIYYGKNNDNQYLEQLKYKNHLEILCGEFCVPNCPMRQKHYEAISASYSGDDKALIEFTENGKCPKQQNDNLPIADIALERPHFVSNQRINELYEMGYSQFKIAGRILMPYDWIRLMIYYLVKPEYHKKVEKIFNEIIKEMNTQIITPKIKEKIIQQLPLSKVILDNGPNNQEI